MHNNVYSWWWFLLFLMFNILLRCVCASHTKKEHWQNIIHFNAFLIHFKWFFSVKHVFCCRTHFLFSIFLKEKFFIRYFFIFDICFGSSKKKKEAIIRRYIEWIHVKSIELWKYWNVSKSALFIKPTIISYIKYLQIYIGHTYQ